MALAGLLETVGGYRPSRRHDCLNTRFAPQAMISETSLLGGKVAKRTLPLVQPSSTPDSRTLKRLLLPQGELAQFYDGDDGIRYIAQIELQAGSVRGNHYHKVKQEWVYMMSGEVTLILEDLESKARETTLLTAGDLVFIQTGVAHALQVTKSGQAIEFSTSRFDPADIYRHKLV
jgi:uncharacterized RmlC-like cupin family protein